jgi:hypothetical protein
MSASASDYDSYFHSDYVLFTIALHGIHCWDVKRRDLARDNGIGEAALSAASAQYYIYLLHSTVINLLRGF